MKYRPIKQSTLFGRLGSWFAAIRIHHGVVPTKEQRTLAECAIRKLCNEKELPDNPPERPYWTSESTDHVIDMTFEKPFLARGLRHRLSVATFVSCSFVQGYRPNSLLRSAFLPSANLNAEEIEAERLRRSGARYGQIALTVRQDGEFNSIIATYSPVYGKTAPTARRKPTMRPGPTIATSPPLMILILAVVDRLITVEDFKSIVSPAFTADETERILPWPEKE